MASRCTSIATALLLVGAGLLCGCADEQESLIVLHSPAWDDDGSCLVDAGNEAALALGVLDVSAHTAYMLPVILQNQLLADQSPSNGIDNGEMQIRSADVTLSMDQTPEIIDALRAQDEALVDFNVPLPTDSLPSGDRVGVLLEIISRPASEGLDEGLMGLEPGSRPVLSARIIFHARRTGNSVGGVGDVEAREYVFPIQICSGCLLTCSTCAGQQCPLDIQGVNGGVCGNAQDLPWAPGGCDNPLDPMGG